MSGVDCGGIDGGMFDDLCHLVSLYRNHRLPAKTHMHRKPNTYTAYTIHVHSRSMRCHENAEITILSVIK